MIISQYLEGTGNSKAIQVRNRGTTTVALDSYALRIFSNGKTDSEDVIGFPSGTDLSAGETFTICNPSLAAEKLCDHTDANIQMDGNDAVALTASADASVVYDSVGTIGVDPVNGGFPMCVTPTATKDHTLRRLDNVKMGNQGQWEGEEGCFDWWVEDVNMWTFRLGEDDEVVAAVDDGPERSNALMINSSLALVGVLIGVLVQLFN